MSNATALENNLTELPVDSAIIFLVILVLCINLIGPWYLDICADILDLSKGVYFG